MTRAGLKGRCFLELKSILLEVSYIKKWPKFAYLELKVPHLKIPVMRDRVYGVEKQNLYFLSSYDNVFKYTVKYPMQWRQ